MRRMIIVGICLLLLMTSTCSAAEPPSWSIDETAAFISLGLMPEEFEADDLSPITRTEFAALITRLADLWAAEGKLASLAKLSVNTPSIVLNDTNDLNAYFCAAFGVIVPDDKGNFKPDDVILRQQAATILYRTETMFSLKTIGHIEELTSENMPHFFVDGTLIRALNRKGVQWCYRNGIMNALDDNFDPDALFTKKEAVASILRLYYLNGFPEKLIFPVPDYYPAYGETTLTHISHWFDSGFEVHSTDELGHIASKEEYAFVIDNIGVGVTYGHVINRAGEKLLSDLYGSNGYFHHGIVKDNLIELKIALGTLGIKYDKDTPFYFVVDMNTGEIFKNKTLDDLINKDEVAAQDKSAPGRIVSEGNGFYALYSKDGKKLSKTYPDEIRHVAGNIFIGCVSDQPKLYDVLYCNGKTDARILRTERFRFNSHVFCWEEELFAIQNTDKKVTVFDCFGDTISEITFKDNIYLRGFVNGLVIAERGGPEGILYFTPNGKELTIQRSNNK